MDFFSNSKPKLVTNNTFKNINKLSVGGVANDSFYSLYIEHNMFVLVLLGILALILLFKYIMKEPPKEKFRAAFNPTLPVSSQQSFVHYLPDDIPVYKNGKIVLRSEIEPPKMPNLTLPDVPEPTKIRNVYTGMTNTYEGAPDHLLEHPFDWINNFNSNTSNSVSYMVDKNINSHNALNDIITNDSNTMCNNINGTLC